MNRQQDKQVQPGRGASVMEPKYDEKLHPATPDRPATPAPVPPALDVVDVHASFRERRSRLPVLNGLSLTVKQGEFVAIVGPSGCGKSTLFHIIGGLLKPQEGQVLMNGQNVTGQRGKISYMPQQPALFPWRTIEDNVLLAGEVASSAPLGPKHLRKLVSG